MLLKLGRLKTIFCYEKSALVSIINNESVILQ